MTDLLWKADAMIAALGARVMGDLPRGIAGISIDTRTLQPGDAYFAIKGDVHDGHKFVAKAYGAGAAISVVSESWIGRLGSECGPLLVVDDVLRSLERLGKAARARTDARIIAVTGSVGKTTTKEALRQALKPSGNVHAAVASYNNHWGVPLTLARMPRSTEFGVIEIGMNHPGEISPLVKMARPHVAIITNVAAVHLGAFKDIDEIARAKAEIFDGLEPGGTAILNGDDKRLPLLEEIARQKGVSNIVRFGEHRSCEAQLEKLVLHGSCSCLTATIIGDPVAIKIGAPGRHIAQNVLSVMAACKIVGGDLAQAGLTMAEMKPVKGRGQRHVIGEGDERIVLIDETYNANPTSVRAALALLSASPIQGRGRHVAVLGDMLELGPTSAQLHAELQEAIVKAGVQRVFLAGPEMRALDKALSGAVYSTHAATIDELIPKIKKDIRGGDIIMAKASLGMKFERLVDDLLNTHAN